MLSTIVDGPQTIYIRPLESRHKVKVEGARRVWGTLSICLASTVQNVIRRICANDTVQVRRSQGNT